MMLWLYAVVAACAVTLVAATAVPLYRRHKDDMYWIRIGFLLNRITITFNETLIPSVRRSEKAMQEFGEAIMKGVNDGRVR